MSSDFGDESGEKLCDWLIDIGRQAGQESMHAAAHSLSIALKRAKGDLSVEDTGSKWARLNLDEVSKTEGYDTVKQILVKQFSDSNVEHSFFIDAKTKQESLLFKHKDASKVDRLFDELIKDVNKSLARADAQLFQGKEPTKMQTKNMGRDFEPLEKRAARVQASSAALKTKRNRGDRHDISFENKFQKVNTK